MTDPIYQPSPAITNPLGCVTSWLGSLFRPRVPAYVVPEEPKATPVVARVRGVALVPGPEVHGTTGTIAGMTLVVDDDQTAAAVLEALHAGAPVTVLSVARCP